MAVKSMIFSLISKLNQMLLKFWEMIRANVIWSCSVGISFFFEIYEFIYSNMFHDGT